MRSSSLLLILSLSTSVLAGCIGDDGTPAPDSDETLAEEAVATAETGSVAGQVVTDELEVIEGASLGLSKGGSIVMDTLSDKQGKFTFNGVPPGTYRLQGTAACCKPDTKEVTVVAGEIASVGLQLARLSAEDLAVPYMVEEEWRGFISCGIGVGGASLAACAVLDDTPAADPNEDFLHRFTVDRNIRELVTVMDWDPVGGVSGGDFRFLVENDGCGGLECSYEYADLRGGPPLRADIDEASISVDEWQWAAIEDNRTLQFRIFAFSDTATVAYQQPFTVYHTAFYFDEAPEDYDPVPDA